MLKLEIDAGLKEHIKAIRKNWNFGNNKEFADKCEELTKLTFKDYNEIYNAINSRGLSYPSMMGFNGFIVKNIK